jgi:hypothetical protein
MTGAIALLHAWLAAAERLAARVPELAKSLGERSWPAAALAAAGGIALLLGGARLGRVLAAAGGALVGWLAGGLVAPAVHGWLPAWLPPSVGAAVLGFASALAPEVYPVVLGLVPGALLGLQVPLGGRPWAGAAVSGAALALLGALLRRLVMAATAAVAGAVLVAVALLAFSGRFTALAVLAQRPMVLAGLAALLAVAGTAFQLGAGGSRGRARRPAREPIHVDE